MRTGSTAILILKRTSGAGGYDPGKITINRENALTKKAWEEFENHLRKADFWRSVSEEDIELDLDTGGSIVGFDGAQWIMEGVKGGVYHVVDRWSPQEGPYRELCLYLLKIAGVYRQEKKRLY